jgi:DNA replication protein DnaC
MNVETVTQQLRALRLPTCATEIEDVLQREKKAVNLSWLSTLLERELDARREKALTLRIRQARFPEITTLEQFDFSFNPNLSEERVRELFTLDFVKQRQIALFLGQPGTGKTHLALALGVEAARAGMKVYCTSVKRLARDIRIAKVGHRLDSLFKQMLSAKLWILDDWGVVSMDKEVTEEVFDLLDRRKHHCALVLTSNRAVHEWPDVFPDAILASATIDRLFEQAKVVTFTGQSYRLRGRIESKLVDGGLETSQKK